MTDKAALLFAKVSAVNAEIEALKAENAHCEHVGRGIAYGEEAFLPLQKKIEEAIEEFHKPAPLMLGQCEVCGAKVFEGDGHEYHGEPPSESGYLCAKCFGDEKRREELFQAAKRDCSNVSADGDICLQDSRIDITVPCSADCCPMVENVAKALADVEKAHQAGENRCMAHKCEKCAHESSDYLCAKCFKDEKQREERFQTIKGGCLNVRADLDIPKDFCGKGQFECCADFCPKLAEAPKA